MWGRIIGALGMVAAAAACATAAKKTSWAEEIRKFADADCRDQYVVWKDKLTLLVQGSCSRTKGSVFAEPSCAISKSIQWWFTTPEGMACEEKGGGWQPVQGNAKVVGYEECRGADEQGTFTGFRPLVEAKPDTMGFVCDR